MKARVRTRKQLGNELKVAARDWDSPESRVWKAQELLGDGTWAWSDNPTTDVDPQSIADAWFAEESKWKRGVVVSLFFLKSFVIDLPRIRPLRPIKIKD